MKKRELVAALILTALLVGGCGGSSTPDNTGSPEPTVKVTVTPIVRTTLPETLVVDGHTEVRDHETVVSPIDGVVVALAPEVGTSVGAGDTVATIMTRESRAAISGAKRLMEQATTPAEKDEARRAMAVAEEGRQTVAVLAGRGGVVTEKLVSEEQTVATGAGLLQVVDLSTLDFVADVPLDEIARVRPGLPCVIRIPVSTQQTLAGTVAAVSAQSNQNSQATPVRIEFTGPADVRSGVRVGMMGTVAISVAEHADVLAVPRSALLRNDIENSYTIYTVDTDSRARVVPVEVGIFTDSLVEVSSPNIKAGDPVIVEGNYEVSDSTRVAVSPGSAQ